MVTEELRTRCLDSTSQGNDPDLLKQAAVDLNGIPTVHSGAARPNNLVEDIASEAATTIKREISSVGEDAALTGCADGFFTLRTARREIRLGGKTLIMGILNVTPDSFSDGGKYFFADQAVEEGLRMAEEGADILDIGGESTRPGSDPVSLEEELRRVIPIIRALSKKTGIPLSIDTMKAEVAREALSAGAEIVNDVSAMNYDKAMPKVVADAGAAIVLMHMRGTPKSMQTGDLTYRSLLGDVICFLKKRMECAIENGIDPRQIMVDPGLGFGKTTSDNLRLIKYLGEFKALGRPIVIGPSRKAFIGNITAEDTPTERVVGTAAAVTAAILNGCNVVRIHDTSAMKKVAAVADAILRA